MPPGFPLKSAAGLVDAIERLAGARTSEQVSDIVRTTARKLLACDGITVVLRDNGFCHYVAEDAIAPLWAGQKFPLETCISGWAMLNADTAIIPDVFADARIPHALYRSTFVRSLIMTPVGLDEPIAAIGAYWAQVRQPTPDEVSQLATLARATATALDNIALVAALSRSLAETELARDELRHRVKNVFATTRALAALTLPETLASRITEKLEAVARAQELLDEGLVTGSMLALNVLVSVELEAFRTESPNHVAVSGPYVVLSAAQALTLGLALNELATNSLKFGALSSPHGRLEVRWRTDGGRVELTWRETKGPKIASAPADGFGSALLRRLVEERLKGALERRFHPEGLSCTIAFPLDVKQTA